MTLEKFKKDEAPIIGFVVTLLAFCYLSATIHLYGIGNESPLPWLMMALGSLMVVSVSSPLNQPYLVMGLFVGRLSVAVTIMVTPQIIKDRYVLSGGIQEHHPIANAIFWGMCGTGCFISYLGAKGSFFKKVAMAETLFPTLMFALNIFRAI